MEQKTIINSFLQHGYLLQGIQDSVTLFIRICNDYAAVKTHADVLANDMEGFTNTFGNDSLLPETYGSYSKVSDALDNAGRKYNHQVIAMDQEFENYKRYNNVLSKALDKYVDEQIRNCTFIISELE